MPKYTLSLRSILINTSKLLLKSWIGIVALLSFIHTVITIAKLFNTMKDEDSDNIINYNNLTANYTLGVQLYQPNLAIQSIQIFTTCFLSIGYGMLADVVSKLSSSNLFTNSGVMAHYFEHQSISLREIAIHRTSPHILSSIGLIRSSELCVALGHSGTGLFDISTLSKPSLKSLSMTRGRAKQCIPHPTNPNYYLVSDFKGGLSAVDITSASEAVLTPRANDTELVNSLFPLPNHQNLVVAAGEYSGDIYDVSDPANPIPVSSFPTSSGNAYSRLIKPIGENLLAIAQDFRGISILNYSSPFDAQIVSTFKFPGVNAEFVDVTEIPRQNTIAVALRRSGVGFIDTTDPSNPQSLSIIETPGYAESITPFAGHDDLLVVSGSRTDGICILNIADPSNPFMETFIKTPSAVKAVISSVKYNNILIAALFKAGLGVFKANFSPVKQAYNLVPQASAPAASTIFGADPASSIVPVGRNRLLTTSDWRGTSLHTYNSTGSELTLDSTTDLPFTDLYAMPVPGGKASEVIIAKGLEIVIQDIYQGVISRVDAGIYTSTLATIPAVDNEILFGGFNAIGVLDIGNGTAPVVRSTLSIDGTIKSIKPITGILESLVCTITDSGKLCLVDISDTSILTSISEISLQSGASEITQIGNYLAVANGESGVNIVDISNPFLPTLVSNFQTLSQALSVLAIPGLAGQFLTADAERGLVLGNTENIRNPVAAFRMATPSDAFKLELFNDTVAAGLWESLNLYTIQALALWQSDLGVFKVGAMLEGVNALVYTLREAGYPSELLRPDPTSVTVRRISDIDGETRQIMSSWLQVNPGDLTFTGIPPREAAGTYTLELAFRALEQLNPNAADNHYKAILRFAVERSLELTQRALTNGTGVTRHILSIQAVAELATIVLTAPENVTFITGDNFGPVIPSFNPATRRLEAFGAVQHLNRLLKELRYVITGTIASNIVSARLTDGGLNYPHDYSQGTLLNFKPNQAPTCGSGVLMRKMEVKDPFDFALRGACTDPDDPHGLRFSLTEDLPFDGMDFDSDLIRLSGKAPSVPGLYPTRFRVTDLFAEAAFTFMLNVTRTRNIAPVAKLLESLKVATRETTIRIVPISDLGFDPDGDLMTIRLEDIPGWLEYVVTNTTVKFTGRATPFDTNPFSDLEGNFKLVLDDPNGGRTMVHYPFTVTGDSAAKLTIEWGSTVLSILGSLYAIYKLGIPLYNLTAWERYFTKNITIGSTQPTDSEDDGCTTECDHKHSLLESKPKDTREKKLKDITEKIYYIVEPGKQGIMRFIPIIFNATYAKLLSRFGIKMNPDYFSTKKILDALPSWLRFEESTGDLVVTGMPDPNDFIAGSKLVIEFLSPRKRIVEQVTVTIPELDGPITVLTAQSDNEDESGGQRQDSSEHGADESLPHEAVVLPTTIVHVSSPSSGNRTPDTQATRPGAVAQLYRSTGGGISGAAPLPKDEPEAIDIEMTMDERHIGQASPRRASISSSTSV